MQLATLIVSLLAGQTPTPAESPLHLAVSAGTGNAYAAAGLQLEAGAGPVSFSFSPGNQWLADGVNLAAGFKLHPSPGWYAFGSWSYWKYDPPAGSRAPFGGWMDRWHTFSLGAGYRLQLPGQFFADVSVGLPYTSGRYWTDETDSERWWWSGKPTSMVGVEPAYTPDFSLSVGYSLGGEELAAPASSLAPILAAGLAGVILDAVGFGVVTMGQNLGGARSPATFPAWQLQVGLFLGAALIRPVVVALVAAATHRNASALAIIQSALLAVLSDAAGMALWAASFLSSGQPWLPALGGFALRTALTPYLSALPLGPVPLPGITTRF